MAGGFVATGRDAAAVAAERERIREYLGFLYSTPQYWPALEVHGFADVGRHLHQLSREGRWGEMRAAIGDALLDALVPAAPYAEIADLLRAWFGDLCARHHLPGARGSRR